MCMSVFLNKFWLLLNHAQKIPSYTLFSTHPCIKEWSGGNICLFVCIDALRPSQQQWSCRDVAAILWDFYQTLGCHDTQNMLHEYNYPINPMVVRLSLMRKTIIIS